MKLSELATIVNRALENAHDGDDPEVAVETQNGGIPTNRLEPVRSAHRGFDWTRRFFVIRTQQPVVVVRGLDKPVRELALQRLKDLEEAYAKLGNKYIAKSRREDWIDGFIEGVRAHVTACNEEESQS